MSDDIPLDQLACRAADRFQARFGRAPRWIVAAPGRVNLIGEHTDYNDGFVLPMAIDRYTVAAADPADLRGVARIYSATMDEQVDLALGDRAHDKLPMWARYVQGVMDVLGGAGLTPGSFEAVIDSTVPLGGGLSSSAALEVSVATLLETITGRQLRPVQKALYCQQAEHEGAGMPCGIMDQFSSVLCQRDHLMLLDCRSQQAEMVPLADPAISVLVINSNVKHELTGSEYARRRVECQQAAEALGVVSLRDVTPEDLEEARPRLDPVLYQRAHHVVGEIDRTATAAEEIRAGDWPQVGELMYTSHESLRDDFQVSCDELDLLVAEAQRLGMNNGVIGSRMTGGGFGGCTVSLVETEAAADVAAAVCGVYHQQTGIEPTSFTTRPAQGALVVRNGPP